MKVKPKHMACISVGSFHLAINQLGLPNVDTEDLVAIAQVSTYLFLYFEILLEKILMLFLCLFSVAVLLVTWSEWLV